MELNEIWKDVDGSIYVLIDHAGRYLGNVYPESDGMGGVVWFAQDSQHRCSDWEDDFQSPREAAEWLAVRSPYRSVLEVA